MPRPSFNHLAMDPDRNTAASPRLYGAPEPNPPFVFPIQAEPSDVVDSVERTSDMDMGRGRHARSRSRPQQLSLHSLPAFEFHPSASSSATTQGGSPARSPTKIASVPAHPSGHRRNGSEFIGGDTRSGGFGLISTSPTKGEGTLPQPSTSRTGPPVNRRGHAHRRSGAISSHDLSTILAPPNEPRGGSAPTTPSNPPTEGPFPPDIESAISQSTSTSSTLSKRNTSIPASHRASASFESQPRPRVEFSDTLEYIPRPLSTISSETSSSLSTIRPNHSLTGSITSIVSAGTSSPPSAKATRSALDTMFEVDPSQPRPKTASPTLRSTEQRVQFQEDHTPFKRPSSSSATENPSSEAKDPHSWRNLVNNDNPQFTPSESSGRDVTEMEYFSGPDSSKSQGSEQCPSVVVSCTSSKLRASPEPKRSKRQRKVKSWAGSILSRRPRQRDTKEKRELRRSPTPPFRNFAPESEFRLEDVNFDDDTTCVIQTPPVHDARPSRVQTDIQSWKPRESSPGSDPDTSGSMLDLDAALGPFNTPSLGADQDDAASGSFSVARRRMHSSGATGGFSGPGMHYHRRTESAPEMVPINYHAFGFPRLNSNPAMADVFEEEEEEEDNESSKEGVTTPHQDVQDSNLIPGLGVNIVDVDTANTVPMLRSRNREGTAAANDERSAQDGPLEQKRSAGSLRSEVLYEEMNAVEIVDADEEPRASVVTKSSDESTITPTLSNEPCIRRPASAPIDFAIPRTHCFTTPESSSCVSSPDFNRTSFDVSRMHTANSSITDRATLSSSRTGELGLSMRGSVDDVPSLISSASTMMSAHQPRFSSSAGNRYSDDPAPPLAAIPRRTRYESLGKRSSLASLSRLVGSSYGEKSKLSIEERAQPDSTEKTERKKGNRLSRLMRFLGNPKRN